MLCIICYLIYATYDMVCIAEYVLAVILCYVILYITSSDTSHHTSCVLMLCYVMHSLSSSLLYTEKGMYAYYLYMLCYDMLRMICCAMIYCILSS